MLARLRLRRPSHTTIVAYLALFVAVGGGTAFAVVAANQVNSESIIDGQVKKPDLAANSVGSGKVIDNSLTGVDINEGTFNQAVPNSNQLGGRTLSQLLTTGTRTTGGGCNPNSTSSVVCASIPITTSATSDFLVVAGGSWFGADETNAEFADGDIADAGSCGLARSGGLNGTDITLGADTHLGQANNTSDSPTLASGFGLTSMAFNVPAGTTTFKVKCAESNKDFNVQDVALSAVRLDRP